MAQVKIPGHLNMCEQEIQNALGWKQIDTPSNAKEAMFWYDSVNHRFKFHNGTTVKDFGIEYSEGPGIDITGETISVDTSVIAQQSDLPTKLSDLTDDLGSSPTHTHSQYQTALTFSTGLTESSGTITVTDYDKLLKNKSSKTGSLNILGTTASNLKTYSVSIGIGSAASQEGSLAIGYYASAYGTNSIAIGRGAQVGLATVSNDDSCPYTIQIGKGTNTTAKTLAIGFGTDNNNNALEYTLLDGTTGLIPTARIDTDTTPTSASTKPITSGGVYTALGNKQDTSTAVTHTASTAAGSATKPVYVNSSGVATECTYTLGASVNKEVPSNAVFTDTTYSNGTGLTLAGTTFAVDTSVVALKSDLVTAYSPAGNVDSASDLPTLSASVLGKVYHVTTSFNTTSDFVEGSGKTIAVGNDITVVDVGTGSNHSYKFNVYGDFIDISGKQDTIDASHKLSSDLVDDTNKTNKFVTTSEKSTWNGKQDALSSSNKLNPSYIATDASNRFVSDTEKSTWNGKQDAISDLSSIRTNASNGASAYTTIQGYGDIVTHNASEFQTSLGFVPCKLKTYNNSPLTASSGEVTWEISLETDFGTACNVDVSVYEIGTNTYTKVFPEITINTSSKKAIIKMNSSSNIAANKYQARVTGYFANAS